MSAIAKALDELGFETGSIVETIIVSMTSDKSLSAAPIGVKRIGPELIEIKPFKTSQTYNNMRSRGEAGVNVTGDPKLFFITAFKEELEGRFKKVVIEDDLSIKNADATLQIKVEKYQNASADRGAFVARILSVKINNPRPRVFSRGKSEAIEAIIHATRIRDFSRAGLQSEVEKLITRVTDCKEVVDRVSGTDSQESKVVRALMDIIRHWRGEAFK